MIAHNAVGIGRARARIHTLLVAAGEHLGAVVVHGALGPAAGGVGVAQEPGRTDAAGLVVLGLADRLGAALLVYAGVLAGPRYAGLRQRTFKVAVAASCKVANTCFLFVLP